MFTHNMFPIKQPISVNYFASLNPKLKIKNSTLNIKEKTAKKNIQKTHIVKHTQTICQEFVNELFKCV